MEEEKTELEGEMSSAKESLGGWLNFAVMLHLTNSISDGKSTFMSISCIINYFKKNN